MPKNNQQNSKKNQSKKSQKKGKRGRKCTDREWKQHFQAFNDELFEKGYFARDIEGDGNCLFRSISDQLEGSEKFHSIYRVRAVEYMQENKVDFAPFMDEEEEEWDEYIKNMKKDGTWGGHFELQALSISLEINFVIHMLNQPPWFINNFSQVKAKYCHLAYHQADDIGEHYSSVRLLIDDTYEPAKHYSLKNFMLKASGKNIESENLVINEFNNMKLDNNIDQYQQEQQEQEEVADEEYLKQQENIEIAQKKSKFFQKEEQKQSKNEIKKQFKNEKKQLKQKHKHKTDIHQQEEQKDNETNKNNNNTKKRDFVLIQINSIYI